MLSKKSLTSILFLLVLLGVAGPSCCGPNTLGIRNEIVSVYAPIEESYVFVTHQFQEKICKGSICLDAPLQAITGSGFAVARSGVYTWVVTAAHLCRPLEQLQSSEIMVISLGGFGYKATVQYSEPTIDLCFMTIEGSDLMPVRVASSDAKRGERVLALASPLGIFDEDMVLKFEGFYAGRTKDVPVPGSRSKKFPVLDGFTIPARPGSSGGPIFNSKGELLGVIIMAKPYFENFALSPPQSLVRDLVSAVQDKAEDLTLVPRVH